MNKHTKLFIEFSIIFFGVGIVVFLSNLDSIIKGGWDNFLKIMGIVAIIYIVLSIVNLILGEKNKKEGN